MASIHVLYPAPRRPAAAQGEPFASAEEAWFWTMNALAARRDRVNRPAPGIPRPCDPDDVVRCLDTLYRQRRIDLVHARVLRVWGERQVAPSTAHPAERCDARIWREALNRLEWPLRLKGIVGKLSELGKNTLT